jgi:hypothetical protein
MEIEKSFGVKRNFNDFSNGEDQDFLDPYFFINIKKLKINNSSDSSDSKDEYDLE